MSERLKENNNGIRELSVSDLALCTLRTLAH